MKRAVEQYGAKIIVSLIAVLYALSGWALMRVESVDVLDERVKQHDIELTDCHKKRDTENVKLQAIVVKQERIAIDIAYIKRDLQKLIEEKK